MKYRLDRKSIGKINIGSKYGELVFDTCDKGESCLIDNRLSIQSESERFIIGLRKSTSHDISVCGELGANHLKNDIGTTN